MARKTFLTLAFFFMAIEGKKNVFSKKYMGQAGLRRTFYVEIRSLWHQNIFNFRLPEVFSCHDKDDCEPENFKAFCYGLPRCIGGCCSEVKSRVDSGRALKNKDNFLYEKIKEKPIALRQPRESFQSLPRQDMLKTHVKDLLSEKAFLEDSLIETLISECEHLDDQLQCLRQGMDTLYPSCFS